MARPEWQNISGYGSQVIPHLPELSDLAIAEVDASGIVLSVNTLGMRTWDWHEGQRLPNAILIALSEIKKGESLVLPVKPGRMSLLAIRMEGTLGWLLIGYTSQVEKLAERASTFRSLIEKIPVLITRMKVDGTVLYANAEARRLTGFGSDEIVNRPFWLEVVHPEDRWKLMGALRRAIEGDKAVVGVRFLTKGQGPRFAEMHLYPTVYQDEAQIEGVVFDVTERSEVEEALFQSEALYRTFLEQSPIGMLHLDAEGTVTFENHQFRQIIGESADDAWIGRAIYIIKGLDLRIRPLLRNMLEEGKAFRGMEITYRGNTPLGFQYLIVHGSPILHPEGGIVGGVLMIEDNTQQKLRDEELQLRNRYGQAETALRKAALSDPSENAFLQETARILGDTTQVDSIYMLVNNAANECCSNRVNWISDGESKTRPILIKQREYTPLREAEALRQSVHIYEKNASSQERMLLDVTGAAEAIWAPFFEAGQLGGFVLFEREKASAEGPRATWQKTEKHLIDQLVRLFETLWGWIQVGDRYRHIINTIDDCLYTFSYTDKGTRRFLFLTKQIEELVGYSAAELVGPARKSLPWNAILYEEDRQAIHAHEEALRNGRESRVIYRVRHKSGSLRWLQEHGTPQRDAMEEVIVSGIITDVTEQKNAEAVLREAKMQAESANKLKSSFIATMSHEIRTPMGALDGFGELLMKELAEYEEQSGSSFPPQITEFLRAIRENSQKLLTLVNDLFDLSNLELGSIKLRRISIPLHDIVMRSTSKVAVTLSQKGVDLRVDLDPSEPIAMGDPHRLEQILDNLLSNAAKFTEEGSVTVRSRFLNGDQVAIEVIDTGVGISPDYLDRLFIPFQQEDDRLNRRFEGSGLGLSLAKQLIDIMGGKIEVESEKGIGSTFRIILVAAGGTSQGRRKSRPVSRPH